MKRIFIFLNFFIPSLIHAHSSVIDNIITKWIVSTGDGYANIRADVIGIKFDENFVYVYTNSIPSYAIGPWPNNSPTPTAQEEVYRFPRMPLQQESRKRRQVDFGPVGLLLNGQAIYSAIDDQSFLDLKHWNYDTNATKSKFFDCCNGRADKCGRYHSHINPICLYNHNETCKHSPILGYMFDGFPIYGPFGYANPFDANSKVKRMISSYAKRSIENRKCYANGTKLNWYYRGPQICPVNPIGTFVEDYEYIEKLGDLDRFNGRFVLAFYT